MRKVANVVVSMDVTGIGNSPEESAETNVFISSAWPFPENFLTFLVLPA